MEADGLIINIFKLTTGVLFKLFKTIKFYLEGLIINIFKLTTEVFF